MSILSQILPTTAIGNSNQRYISPIKIGIIILILLVPNRFLILKKTFICDLTICKNTIYFKEYQVCTNLADSYMQGDDQSRRSYIGGKILFASLYATCFPQYQKVRNFLPIVMEYKVGIYATEI
jgi:hypothetical protein